MNRTTNKLFDMGFLSRQRNWMSLAILVAMFLLADTARAQEGGQGNTTIFGGAEMTMFQNYDFVTGGGGVQPGVVLTQRATGNFGVLNFSGAGLLTTGANNANYVDGYVRKYGTGQFVFPVGDDGKLGAFAASADATIGAYFRADPNTAISNDRFTGGFYPVLPSGGPFPTANIGTMVDSVSTLEYWDIDGNNPTKITLTWNATSSISGLTGGSLSKLTIVGWNPGLSQWVKIPATFDPTSVLGGASTLTAGSITTDATIIPSNFTVYTFATAVPDLTPTIDIDALSFPTAGSNRDFIVNLYEINKVDATNTAASPIRFRINKLSGFTITWPTVSGNSNVFGGSPNQNSNWTFSQNSFFITVTANVGVNILAEGSAQIGFNISRNPGVAAGTTQNITATVIGGAGGENNTTNNQIITSVTAN